MFRSLKLGQYRLRQWIRGIFAYPTKTLSTEPLAYDDYWDTKRPRSAQIVLSPMERARAELIARSMPDGVRSIGDIGSGPGTVLHEILRLCPGLEGVAYDSSVRARRAAEELGLRAIPLDLRADPSLSSVIPADVFIILEVLEHIPDAEQVLAAVVAKSTRGVFFSVPNTGFFMHRFRLLFGKVPAQWIHMPNEHLRFWTIVDMRWWLNAQGYSKYTIVPYRGIPILNRLMPNLFAEGILVFARV